MSDGFYLHNIQNNIAMQYSQDGCFYHRTVLFPVIRRYCSADVKILVLPFTFATQKSTKKTPKHVGNSSSRQHSDAHMRILFTWFIYIWDSGTAKHAVYNVHSVVRCYLAVNATLIVNSISNSEQTDKSVWYESDEIRNSFWKKPVGISPACCLPLCRWKYYYSSQADQVAIEIVQ